SDPVALTGNPGDANIVSQGFTVNGVPSTTFNPAQGLGAYTIVYTVNGGQASGNDPGCIQSVSTIVNVVETPSVLVCNELVHVSLDEDCSQELTPNMILEGSFVCYDDYTVSIDRTQPLGNGPWATPAVVGLNDINKTWAVKVTHSISGSACWGLIKVEDKLAPVPTCTNFEVSCAETNLNPSFLANTLGITAAFPSVVENCGTYTQSYSDVATDFGCNTNTNITANVVRTWVVKDASGNESSCSQTINIISTRVSDVQFPVDATVSCGANANTNPSATGTPYLTFNYPSGARNYAIWPEANACELQAGFSDQILPICDGSYKILRTWTVYDWCVPTSPFPPTQNPQYYIQLIKVLDESAPSWICPEDMTVSTNASTCCANVDLPNVVMTDNCSRINRVEARVEVYDQYTGDLIATHDLNGTLTTFAGNNLWDRDTMANFGFTPCLPVGTHKVTYTAYDDCGNYASCQFDLTVEDQTPPVAVCDEWTQVALINNGTALVDATTYDDGSYDNCGPVYFKVRRMDNSNCQSNENFVDQARFCCEDINDTITVILRVYDVNPGAGPIAIDA
ncbi:MAG: HYR domain-containing protein, partial [Bacteroidota bacterium]